MKLYVPLFVLLLVIMIVEFHCSEAKSYNVIDVSSKQRLLIIICAFNN